MARATGIIPMDRVSRIRRRIEEGGEQDLFSPNYVSHEPWHQAAKRLALKKNSRKAKPKADDVSFEREKAFFQPDMLFADSEIKVESAVEQGDEVVVRWKLRGKWTKPFLKIEPSNQLAEITGVSIYRFVGDKIVESTGELDLSNLARQAFAAGATAESCSQAFEYLSRVNPAEVLPGEPGGISNPDFGGFS